MKIYCIVCPQGCALEITEKGGEISVVGNKCKRGAEYGRQEYLDPRRTVTSIVRLACDGVVPVKTSEPVPKDKIFEVLAEIKKITVPRPVLMGDIIIKNVCGLPSDIVATKSVK